MTGTAATQHGMMRIGKTIENNKETGTAEEAGKKTKPKDPKEEAEKAKKGTETKTLTPAKKLYTKERESEYRASQDLKRNKR